MSEELRPDRGRYLNDAEYHYKAHLVGLILWTAFTRKGQRAFLRVA